MAYGKIKADSIIYDSSGSDVEKTIASLAAAAPTANPTFTGTVTIPTPSAGDNSTKAASTAYVVNEFATKASPALTGTATGVNLTLSGNLTVNGTTTTVATTNTTVTDNLLELNSGAGSNANDSGILIERGSTGDNAIIAWDESADKFIVGTTTAVNTATGDLTIAAGVLVTSTVEDSKGDVRDITQNTQSGTYTLVAADAGKHIFASNTVTIPNSVFAAGDAVTIVNNTAGNITLTASIGTLYNSSDGSTGNRTLAQRGMVSILFVSGTVAHISGAGLT
tara:strand:- start:1354 stop:2193 length:840 start_codon:yes stop_codon:yes gene_type:complete